MRNMELAASVAFILAGCQATRSSRTEAPAPMVAAAPSGTGSSKSLASVSPESELCLILGDGVDQAANFTSCTTSIPSLNFTPLMIFGN
jgi:hypothetical protein